MTGIRQSVCPLSLELSDVVVRRMGPAEIPAAVQLFADHLSRAFDPFYVLRGLPFCYYLQCWQTVVSRSVFKGLATVAVLNDQVGVGLQTGNLQSTCAGNKQKAEGTPQIVCAMSALPADEFSKIDEEDSKHGDREVENAVYDDHFEAFLRKPHCPLDKLLYIVGAVMNPAFHCHGVVSRIMDLGLRIAADQGFSHAFADLLSNSGANVAIKKLGVKPGDYICLPLRAVQLKDGRRPFSGRMDVPEFAILAWMDLSKRSLPFRSRL